MSLLRPLKNLKGADWTIVKHLGTCFSGLGAGAIELQFFSDPHFSLETSILPGFHQVEINSPASWDRFFLMCMHKFWKFSTTILKLKK